MRCRFQWVSGEAESGNQPFKTVKDYDDWIKRASVFGSWADSAIVYFQKGNRSRICFAQNR